MLKKLLGSIALAGLLLYPLMRQMYSGANEADIIPNTLYALLPVSLVFFAISLWWAKVKNKKKALKIISIGVISLLVLVTMFLVYTRLTYVDCMDCDMPSICYENPGGSCSGPE